MGGRGPDGVWQQARSGCAVAGSAAFAPAPAAPFPGTSFVAVDDQRLVVSPYCDHTLTVHDLTTGKIIGNVALPDGAVGGYLARIDAHTVATLWGHSDSTTPWQLAWVHVPAGQPPALGKIVTIPACRAP